MSAKRTSSRTGLVPYLAVAAAVFVSDQVTKFWAVGRLTNAFAVAPEATGLGAQLQRFWTLKHPVAEGIHEVLASCWQHRYVENPGAAWGFLSRSGWAWRTEFFLGVSAVSLVGMAAWLWRTERTQRWVRLGLAGVLGGALGNLLDRARLGYVIDFIDWHLDRRFFWPTFNLADAGISIGVALLILDSLRQPKR